MSGTPELGALLKAARWLLLPGWWLLLAWEARSWQTEVLALSEDDLARMLLARRVAGGEWLPDDLWPPLPMWLAGGLVAAGVPAALAPMLVNVAAISLATALFLRSGARVDARVDAQRGEPLAPLLIASLLLALPWTVRLALSGLAEPVALAGLAILLEGAREGAQEGARGDLRASGRASGLIAAGAVVAILSRYEAWLLLPAASWLLARQGRGWRAIPWMAIPWLAAAGWAWLHHLGTGEPPGGFALVVRQGALEAGVWSGPAGGAWRAARDGWEAGGVLLPAAAGGWAASGAGAGQGGQDGAARVTAGLAAWLIAGLIALSAAGFVGLHNGPRLWLGAVWLLGWMIRDGLARAEGRWQQAGQQAGAILAGVVLTLHIALQPMRGAPPAGYDPLLDGFMAQVRREMGTAGGGPESVMVEVQDWDCVVFALLSGAPERVVWDREPGAQPTGAPFGGRSPLRAPEDYARRALAGAGWAITTTEATALQAGAWMERRAAAPAEEPRYILWAVPGRRLTPPGSAPAPAPR